MSEVKEGIEQVNRPMVARALVIGLGTTGLRVVTDIRRQISLRWGDPADLPSIEYLVLETNNQELEKRQNAAGELRGGVDLPGEKRISLAVSSTGVYRETMGSEPYLRWLAPEAVQGDFTLGAGGVRMKGRLALFHHYQAVKEAIRTAVRRVAYLREGDRFALRQKVWLYLAGTLGGGTASGCFIDLAYICRQVLEEEQVRNQTLMGMFTLPLASEASHNQAVNAYAALQELNHWNYGGSVFSAQYTQQPRHRIQRSEQPFDYCFLLGPTNSCGVLLSEREQNEKIADFIFLATATDALDKVHGDLVDQELALVEPDGRGCPQHYLSFGLNTIEFPLLTVQSVLARHMAHSILKRWTREVDFTRIALPEAAREMLGRVQLGTEGVTEELQVIARIMKQDTQDDVMSQWRTRSRPRIEARVNEYLSTAQFDGIPQYLEEEFNRNIEPLNRGYDAAIDPLDQDEMQLGDMLRAMRAGARSLVATAAGRIVEEVAGRWTGPGGVREGSLMVGHAVLAECARQATELAATAQEAADAYKGQNEGFNGDRREQQTRIAHLADSFIVKLMGNPRVQIDVSFRQWMDATENYLNYTVAFYAYSYAAALYRRVALQLARAGEDAQRLIGDLGRQALALERENDAVTLDEDSLWKAGEIRQSYEAYRDPAAEEEVTAAALRQMFAGTPWENTPHALLLSRIDYADIGKLMVAEAARKFESVKRENVLERWWRQHQERGDTETALLAFLKGSAPYLDFPQQDINDFQWREQLSRRTYSMHGADGLGSRAEREFRRALMRIQPPGYYGGAPKESQFQPAVEQYLVAAAVTVAGFPLQLAPLVQRLQEHFNQGKTRTSAVEGAAPVYSRRDVAFRPISVPALRDQRRAWRLLALGHMLGIARREADPNGVRFRYSHRDRSGNVQTLLSEYIPNPPRPDDPALRQELHTEQTARKEELQREFQDSGEIGIPPMLRGLVISLCGNVDGLNALERAIAERVHRDRLAARKEFVDHRNRAEAQGLEWWPWLNQVYAEWEREVLRLPPADNVGRIERADDENAELEVGASRVFELCAFTADGSDTPLGNWDAALLTWHSDDESIAVPEVRGCRGVREGETRVWGEFPNSRAVLTVEYRVSVRPQVTAIAAPDGSAMSLDLGSERTDRAPIRLVARDSQQPPTQSPMPASRLEWRSTRPNVAVAADGWIVGKEPGEAEVIGEYTRAGGEKLRVTFQVRVWPTVRELVIQPGSALTVAPGQIVTLEAAGRNGDREAALDPDRVVWSMPATTAGELRGNRFIALQAGQAIVKAELPLADGRPLLAACAISVAAEGAAGAGPAPVAAPPLPPEAAETTGAELPEAGMTRAQVLALLGKPPSQQKEVRPDTDDLHEHYFYDRVDGSVVQVSLVNGRVTSVRER